MVWAIDYYTKMANLGQMHLLPKQPDYFFVGFNKVTKNVKLLGLGDLSFAFTKTPSETLVETAWLISPGGTSKVFWGYEPCT